jgi:hypothetical protein
MPVFGRGGSELGKKDAKGTSSILHSLTMVGVVVSRQVSAPHRRRIAAPGSRCLPVLRSQVHRQRDACRHPETHAHDREPRSKRRGEARPRDNRPSSAMQSPMESPAGTPPPISNPRTFWPKPKKKTSPRVDAKELPTLLTKMLNYDGDAITRLAM